MTCEITAENSLEIMDSGHSTSGDGIPIVPGLLLGRTKLRVTFGGSCGIAQVA